MPKRIDNLQEVILTAAKEQLMENGFPGLNIRTIAKSCGIATGTIYNYYSSKDLLAANVMLTDWNLATRRMMEEGGKAERIQDLLRVMYIELREFYKRYEQVWAGYTFSAKSTYSFQDRHELLRGQLAVVIEDGLNRHTKEKNPYMAEFLADNLLTLSGYKELDYDEVEEIWNRLFIS